MVEVFGVSISAIILTMMGFVLGRAIYMNDGLTAVIMLGVFCLVYLRGWIG